MHNYADHFLVEAVTPLNMFITVSNDLPFRFHDKIINRGPLSTEISTFTHTTDKVISCGFPEIFPEIGFTMLFS